MVHKKTDDEKMLEADPAVPPGAHTIGNDWMGTSSAPPGTTPYDDGIAAHTPRYRAYCSGCSWKGDDTTDRRAAEKDAQQHQVDYPGHSAFVQAVQPPTA